MVAVQQEAAVSAAEYFVSIFQLTFKIMVKNLLNCRKSLEFINLLYLYNHPFHNQVAVEA